MSAQKELKKRFNYRKDVRACSTCRYCLPADPDSKEIICKKTEIVIENQITGKGDETLTHICDVWRKGKS